MTNDAKHKTLIFLLLVVIATVMIAAALPQLELKPGIPLPEARGTSEARLPENPPIVAIPGEFRFTAIMAAVVIAVLALVVGGYRLSKEFSWKKVPWPALIIALLALVVLGILFSQIGVSDPLEPELLPPESKLDGPPLGSLPPGLVWLVWIGLVGLIGFLGVWAIRRPAGQTRAHDPVKVEAERAMRALKTGLDLKNVIVRCYWQMSLALREEQGIELEETMTAREFERLLTARGVPYAPVHQLTRLFETARYSLQPSTPTDEELAFECLSAIVQHSREGRHPV